MKKELFDNSRYFLFIDRKKNTRTFDALCAGLLDKLFYLEDYDKCFVTKPQDSQYEEFKTHSSEFGVLAFDRNKKLIEQVDSYDQLRRVALIANNSNTINDVKAKMEIISSRDIDKVDIFDLLHCKAMFLKNDEDFIYLRNDFDMFVDNLKLPYLAKVQISAYQLAF
jgi:hypothetical protein